MSLTDWQTLFLILGSIALILNLIWNIVLGIIVFKAYKEIVDSKRNLNNFYNGLKISLFGTLLKVLGGNGGDKYGK